MRDRRLTPRRKSDRRFLLLISVLFASTFALGAWFAGYGYSDARCVDAYRQNVTMCSTDITCQMADDDLFECIGGAK